ncbi:MAG: cation:proton antiporter [Christensenellales bacterium]|nr:cation:proton antiporter [Clostridiales bacterium]
MIDSIDLLGSLMFKAGVAIFLAFWGGKLAKKLHLPNVSGYVIVGLLLGPSLSLIFKNYGGFINVENAKAFSFISELTIAFIAFSIGAEFTKKSVQKMGKSVFIMTFFESLFAIVLVALLVYFVPQKHTNGTMMVGKEKLAFSLVLGAMAAATAPAATLMVMRQYRAYGPVSMRVVGITALDDIFGIITFGIALAVAKILMGITQMSTVLMIFLPIIEIVCSVGMGVFFGVVLVVLAKRYDKARDDIQVLIISAILLIVGLSKILSNLWIITFSPLLANIVMGTFIANLARKPKRTFDALNDMVATFYVLFFTFAGASLNLGVLKYVGFAGIVFIVARAVGKYLGAFVGAKIAKESKAVALYTGLALLPQGGISIGLLVVLASTQGFEELYIAASTIIMVSILFYETLGPIFSKIAISKAGEIGGADRFLQQESEDPDDYQKQKDEQPSKTSIVSKLKNHANVVAVEEGAIDALIDEISSVTVESTKDALIEDEKIGEKCEFLDGEEALGELEPLYIEVEGLLEKKGIIKEVTCDISSHDKHKKQ